MRKKFFSFVMLCSILLFAQNSQANLILNGSFEDNPIAKKTWKWNTASNISGWRGSNIELWNNLFGIQAPDGEHIIELNAHPYSRDQFEIWQSFATEIGSVYDVSLFYRARRNSAEAFKLRVYSSLSDLLNVELNDHTTKHWYFSSWSFEADSLTTTLALSSLSPLTKTQGNLIDNVSVVKRNSTLRQASVDEPQLTAVLLASFLLIVMLKRFKK